MAERLAEGMTALLIYLQGYVRGQKLSGNPLKAHSGMLARSINWDVQRTPSGVIGILFSQREVAKYNFVHEYGGAFTIPQHVRHVTKLFGRILPEPLDLQIRQHIAHFPERSYLRSSVSENQDRFRGMVLVARNRAVSGAPA
jgi:hypothetical protein